MGFKAAQSLQFLTGVFCVFGALFTNALVYTFLANIDIAPLIEGVAKATLIVQSVALVIMVDFDNASFSSLWYCTATNIAASFVSGNVYFYIAVIVLLPFFAAL